MTDTARQSPDGRRASRWLQQDSWAALRALRADLNPRGFGVLWDLARQWMATTPTGGVVSATSADALRRAVRRVDGSTEVETATLPAVEAVEADGDD